MLVIEKVHPIDTPLLRACQGWVSAAGIMPDISHRFAQEWGDFLVQVHAMQAQHPLARDESLPVSTEKATEPPSEWLSSRSSSVSARSRNRVSLLGCDAAECTNAYSVLMSLAETSTYS